MPPVQFSSEAQQLPPQTNLRYDLSKLTKEEWEEYKRMKRKTLVSPDER